MASTIACAAAWVLCCPISAAGASITPATFEEIVNIGSFTREGADLGFAESVSLTVLSSEFAERGGGSGNAWIVPVNPVSTGIDLDLTGGTNPSGIGGTAFTQTRYQYTVVKLDPLLPDIVDLTFSGFASVSVENNQPQGIPTWFSYALIWVDSRQFAVRNSDANGIYTGLFEDEWHQVPLGSFAVGQIGTIELDAFSHGEGSGPDFRFRSQVLIDPTIEVSSPNAQGYRVEFSPGIVVPPAATTVPEPATLALLTLGLAGVASRRRRAGRSHLRQSAVRNVLPIATFVLFLVPGVSSAAELRASPPGAAIQFAPCFQTAEQRSATISAIRRSLRDPETGQNPDVRSVCSNEDWIWGRETLGVWLSPLPPAGDLLGRNNVRLLADAERRRGLAEVDLLQSENNDDFGWSLNAAFIETLRSRVWAAMPHQLNDDGEEDDEGSVHLQSLTVRLVEPDTVRTTVNGFYDLGPNADFRLRITDTITNVDGKLTVDREDDLHVDNSAYELLAGIFMVFFKPVGFEVFDEIDQAMMHLSMPDSGQSLGALIVQFAPNQFMIDNGQKINFTHTRFLVNETGVTGGGRARLENRDPSVTIRGPLTPSVRSRTVTFSYTALPLDLRPTANQPLQVSWFRDGALVADGSSTQVDIPFEIPRNVAIGGVSEHRVRVRTTDVDGLTAARTITVRISYEPNGPPVCREKPYLPQCGPPRGRPVISLIADS